MRIINVVGLKRIIDNVSLIDVRELHEYEVEHIKGSILIPLSELSISKLPLGTVVIYCRSGVRSLIACTKLLNKDNTLDIYSLEGGIIAWKKYEAVDR